MKIELLDIHNFMSIGDATIELSDRGVVLIQGENADNTAANSNGSGKSSIADALCWCLFGTTARGVTGDDVINRSVGKGTHVLVEIVDDSSKFCIERFRKHPKFKNSLKVFQVVTDASGINTAIDLTKGTDKLTQEVVERVVGCGEDVFRTTIYSGQEQMPDIPGMTDKQLKLLVEEAAGTTLLEKAYVTAQYELKDLKTRIQTGEATLTNLGVLIADHKDSLKMAEAAADAWYRNHTADFLVLKDHGKSLAAQIKDQEVKLSKFDAAEISTFETKLSDMDKAIAGLNENKHSIEKAKSLAELQFKNINDKLAEQVSKSADLFDLITDLKAGFKAHCKECGSEIQATPEQIERHEKEHAEIDAQIKRNKALCQDERDKVTKYKDEIDRLETMISAETVNRDVYKASKIADRDTYNSIKNFIDKLKVELNGVVARIKGMAATANPHAESIKNFKAKIANIEGDASLIKDSTDKLAEEMDYKAAAVEVFSPSGVRARILDEVTPFLNAQTAKYLGVMTDGNTTATWNTLTPTAKGELRERFAIDVTDSTGGESFKSLSGGEKRKVRIAAALSIQDLVSCRAEKPIDLFIGDEIDDALDVSGQERLMTVLNEKAKERGTVLLISHSDLKDWISNVITVTKKDGKSTIKDEAV